MSDFIATLGPDHSGNWDICKRDGLWGIVGRGSNWRKNAEQLRAGDRVFVWRGGRPNGFIAQLTALGPTQLVGPGVPVPWPNPGWFGAVFPMTVVVELDAPEGDRFPNADQRVSSRFGFNNITLQHIFEKIPDDIARRVAAVFPAPAARTVGRPHAPTPPPTPASSVQPPIVDPDTAGRGLIGHHETVERLAAWLRGRGIEPLVPTASDPRFDLAWRVADVLHVAEIKSTTAANEEHQLRLGLGQILRYRQQLHINGMTVAAWLVPEHAPTDPTWPDAAAAAGIQMCWPGAWPSFP